MAFDLVAEQVTTASDFLIYFAIAANKRTSLASESRKPVFSCIKVQFPALRKIVRSNETGNYETNVSDHYDTHPIIRMSIEVLLQKNSEFKLS